MTRIPSYQHAVSISLVNSPQTPLEQTQYTKYVNIY